MLLQESGVYDSSMEQSMIHAECGNWQNKKILTSLQFFFDATSTSTKTGVCGRVYERF